MTFRFRRRRHPTPHRRRGLVAAAAALLIASTSIAVVVSALETEGATPLFAHRDALLAAVPRPDGLLDPGDAADLPDPLVAAQPGAASATAPALPAADDARLRAVPHIEPPAVTAGPHAVNVPILMYHFLRDDRNPSDVLGWRLSVTPADFALQLALLKREGFTTVSLGDVVSAMQTGARLPARPIVLTFDDGYANFATVGAPLLKSAGFTATSFVVSDFVGRPGFMTADQVRKVAGSGITIGAHSAHHVDLARVPPAVAQQEIAGSRAALQKLTGQPVTDFAYPSGQFNQQVVELVQQAGFRDAVTTVGGLRHDSGLVYTMTRVRVSGGESLAAFGQSLGGAAPSAPASPAGGAAPPGPGSPVGALAAAAATTPRAPGPRGVRPS